MSENIWIALIGAIGGILSTLGVGKIIPTVLKWIEEAKERKRKLQETDKQKLDTLEQKIAKLEADIDEYRSFKVRTETAFITLLPVIKEIMKDHPAHVALFEQLRKTVFGNENPEQ